MSPSPSTRHQLISGNLYREVSKQLTKKTCKIFYAPFDVRLKTKLNDEESFTVVQPDLCIVCNLEMLDEKGCNGAPTLIVEILSNSNSKHDLVTKYELYEEAGVNEYWVVYPYEKVIDVFLLINGRYQLHKKYIENDIMKSVTLSEIEVDMKEVFEE
jgi:Uma2 family endonuclease